MRSRSSQSSAYHDARIRRQKLCRAAKKGGKWHTKVKSFTEAHFPFHRLPREIIAEIFILCLPDSENAFKSKDVAPLLLSSVSPSWRSLAFSIPHLWNKLCIKVSDPQVDVCLAATMAQNWIARSGDLPLTLFLYAIRNKKGKDTVKAHLDTFFRYASRWESVNIDMTSCSSVSFPKFGPTPLLRKFSYSTTSPISTPFPFTSCPLLANFAWPYPCSTTSNSDIPWQQLTHIKLEHTISTHQTLDILHTCKMLANFKAEIDDNLSSVQELSRGEPIENKTLQIFHIRFYPTCSVLLQSLTLPALIELELDTDFDGVGFVSIRPVHHQLLKLFSRSKCKLERLKLGDCGFSDASILKCLRHESCSSLKELSIENLYNRPMLTDNVIIALTDTNGPSSTEKDILLPNLSSLSLEMCISASPGVFGLMILSRCLWWDKDDQLKSLSLIATDLDDMDDALLDVASESGVDVTVTLEPYSDSEFAEELYDTDDD